MNTFFESVPYVGHVITSNIFVAAVAVVIATLLVAQITQSVIIATLRRLTRHTRTRIDDKIIDALQRPLFYSVIIAGAMVIASLHGVPAHVHSIVFKLMQTALIFLWSLFFFKLVRAILYKSKDAPNVTLVQEQTLPLFENAAFVAVVGAATYGIFAIWGINMTAWLASAGIIGMALGFAAKDTLANLFAGVFIIADRPYKIGDYIELDSGERGRVTHIGLRSTRILRRDDVEVTVPNAVMGNTKITNESGGPSERFRVRIDIGVAYGSDIDAVERELLAAAREVELVLSEPAPRARFIAFGDSALAYSLYYWVAKPEQRGESRHKVNRAIYTRFAAANIEIPFPQRVVHMINEKH